MRYPLAPHAEWWGDRLYKMLGGRLVSMSPRAFLRRARPLTLDDESRENIDLLVEHVRRGGKLDPLVLRADGREDGRHRAYAAIHLDIDRVPVILYPAARDHAARRRRRW